jgi:4-amino-4-deoxy-L-arabinose transferase-like glycosyltransferase
MRQSGHSLFAAFLLIWLLINWGQAFATQLDPDEAYYWVYSRQLALGYFDHPPVVALMIAAGYELFANELGVRLLTGILHIGTLAGIWVLVGKPSGKKDTWLLIALLTAMPMLQVYAFITTPDVPLLFFGIWYLVVFRRFLQSPNARHALLLGLLMAALLYSKYHGLVWIGLIGLAHFRTLVRQPWFYAAAGFGLVLFLPHLYWQYDHNFPSFTYHLSGRDDPYELKHTTSYLLNQVAIFSPLVFPLLVWALVKHRSQDILQPSFTWLLFGFWIFFFAMSFKGHVEPQWTVLLTFPLVIIGYRHALETPGFRKWLLRMAVASGLLLLIVRVFLIVPVGEVLRIFIALNGSLNYRNGPMVTRSFLPIPTVIRPCITSIPATELINLPIISTGPANTISGRGRPTCRIKMYCSPVKKPGNAPIAPWSGWEPKIFA